MRTHEHQMALITSECAPCTGRPGLPRRRLRCRGSAAVRDTDAGPLRQAARGRVGSELNHQRRCPCLAGLLNMETIIVLIVGLPRGQNPYVCLVCFHVSNV